MKKEFIQPGNASSAIGRHEADPEHDSTFFSAEPCGQFHKSEDLLVLPRSLFEEMEDIVAWYSVSGQCKFANKAYYEFLITVAPTRDNENEVCCYKNNVLFRDECKKTAEAGVSRRKHFSVLDYKGEKQWYEIRFIPQMVSTGTVESILCIGFNITEFMINERNTQAQIRTLQTMVEHSPDPMVRFDRKGRRLYANAAQQKLTKLPLNEQIGKTPLEYSTLGGSAPQYQAWIMEAVETGDVLRRELKWQDPAGIYYHYEVNFCPEHAPDGKVESVLMVGRDISYIKAAEQKLRAREKELRSILENTPDSITRYDLDSRRVFVNSGYLALTGAAPDESLNKTPIEYSSFDEDEAALFQSLIQSVISTAEAREITMQWQKPDKSYGWADFRIIPEFNSEGQVETVLTIARDISSAKEAEDVRFRCSQEFHTVVENSPDMIIRHDREGTAVYVNRAVELFTGIPQKKLLGKKAIECRWLKGDALEYNTILRNVFSKRRPGQLEVQLPDATGDTLDFSIRFVPEFSRTGYVADVLVVWHDITAFKNAEKQQQAREREFRMLVENSPDPIVRYDFNGFQIYMNKAHLELTGECLGKCVNTICKKLAMAETNSKVMAEIIDDIRLRGRFITREFEIPRCDGSTLLLECRFIPEYNEAGILESILSIGRDVTALREAKKRIDNAEKVALLGHWSCDMNDGIFYFSKGARNVLRVKEGWTPILGEVLRLIPRAQRRKALNNIKQAISMQEKQVTVECSIPGASVDQFLLCHAYIEYSVEGVPVKLSGILQDVSAMKSYQQQLQTLAFQDPLTGLPNRALFKTLFNHAIAEAVEDGKKCGFMLIDLDNFKTINDSFGHALGDSLLCDVGKRMKRALRTEDTVARLGGDEFAIILPDITNTGALMSVADKIIRAFSKPVIVDKIELFVTCSIGAVECPSDSIVPEELLRFADAAMYKAKANGRNNVQIYDRKFTSKIEERTHIERALRTALQKNELELHYQPQIAINSGEILGIEALMRWNHPTLGFISPTQFISIAEETGLIHEMGSWAIREVCSTTCDLNNNFEADIRGAVNLSPRQFMTGDVLTTVEKALENSGCRPEWLELEITESLLMDKREGTRETLELLHAMGLSIAIDDFGTGYSSLSYLASFPVDTLKIDRAFINDVHLIPDRAELVKAIISMAKSLRIELIAEGVETTDQEDFLKKHNCPLAQGYLYARPMPLSQLYEFFKENSQQLSRNAY